MAGGTENLTRKGMGRPKGSRNICGRHAQDQILQALECKGGIEYLMKLEDRLFVALLGRVLPKDVSIEDGGGVLEVLKARAALARAAELVEERKAGPS